MPVSDLDHLSPTAHLLIAQYGDKPVATAREMAEKTDDVIYCFFTCPAQYRRGASFLVAVVNEPKEIFIRGGLSREPRAVLIGSDGSRCELQAEPGQSADDFLDHVRAEAIAAHADTIIFCGLPPQ